MHKRKRTRRDDSRMINWKPVIKEEIEQAIIAFLNSRGYRVETKLPVGTLFEKFVSKARLSVYSHRNTDTCSLQIGMGYGDENFTTLTEIDELISALKEAREIAKKHGMQ